MQQPPAKWDEVWQHSSRRVLFVQPGVAAVVEALPGSVLLILSASCGVLYLSQMECVRFTACEWDDVGWCSEPVTLAGTVMRFLCMRQVSGISQPGCVRCFAGKVCELRCND
jgi:hypothetical protein